jgi:hypothetical protein
LPHAELEGKMRRTTNCKLCLENPGTLQAIDEHRHAPEGHHGSILEID